MEKTVDHPEVAFVVEHCAQKLYESMYPEWGPWNVQAPDTRLNFRIMATNVLVALWDFDKDQITAFFTNEADDVKAAAVNKGATYAS